MQPVANEILDEKNETIIALFMAMYAYLFAQDKNALGYSTITNEALIMSAFVFTLLIGAKKRGLDSRYATALQAGTIVNQAISIYTLSHDAVATCVPPLLFGCHIARKNKLLPEIVEDALKKTVQIEGVANNTTLAT